MINLRTITRHITLLTLWEVMRGMKISSFVYPLVPIRNNKTPTEAEEVREHLKEYFQGNGSVPWQYAE